METTITSTASSTRQEEWRQIPFNPSYEVSSLGRVRHTFKNGNIKYLKPIVRDLHPGKFYLYVEISGRKRYVHRLVAQAFLPDYSESLTVDHINEVQDDNRACNLRMCTGADNSRFWRMNHPERCKGSNAPKAPAEAL